MEGFIIYWILTTIVGTVWLLMGYLDKQEYISVGDILGCFLISGMLAWVFVIMWLLEATKIKINKNGRSKK
jgi:hypothetical protein